MHVQLVGLANLAEWLTGLNDDDSLYAWNSQSVSQTPTIRMACVWPAPDED